MKLSVTSDDKFQSRHYNCPVTPDIFPQNGAHLADEKLEIIVSRSGKLFKKPTCLIMSSKVLSKLLCKYNKANSTQTATAKIDYLVVSGPHDNFDKLPNKNRMTGNFVWSDAVFFFFVFTY